MKKSIQFLLALVVLCVGACKHDALDPVGNWTITPATLSTPTSGTTIVLDEAHPATAITFSWTPAVTSNNFGVAYTVVIDSADNADFSSPIATITPANAGRELTASITAQQLNYALSVANYPANATASLKWGVISTAIDKSAVASAPISFKRFATELMPTTLYITGTASENGTDFSKATALRERKDANETGTNIFDVYTTLTAGGKYKFYSEQAQKSLSYGGNGTDTVTIVKGGAAIAAPKTTGQYRVTLNLNTNKYELLHITKWSVVGDALPDGWGGDDALDYKGNGLWQASKDLVQPENASFIFRANGDWGYIIKRIVGSTTDVLMEGEAGDAGKSVENIPGIKPGKYIITLNLAAGAYVYSVEKDPNAPAAIDAPDALFLLEDGTSIATFTKTDKTFTSDKYIAMNASKTYSLNSKSDGSGTSYAVSAGFGDTTTPTADAINGLMDLSEAETPMAVTTTQAYNITVNFETLKVSWKYYNMKMFHWDDPNGGWDARNEYVMTYVDPYTFTVTAQINANFDLKFNSPWDVQFGTDAATLSGTMTNMGPNYTGVTSSGVYKATIVVAPDYSTCTYSFVKQ